MATFFLETSTVFSKTSSKAQQKSTKTVVIVQVVQPRKMHPIFPRSQTGKITIAVEVVRALSHHIEAVAGKHLALAKEIKTYRTHCNQSR